MRLHSLDEVRSLVLSTREFVNFENEEDLRSYLYEDTLTVDGLKGTWLFEGCFATKEHFWIIRNDVEGHLVDVCEPCDGCAQKKRDLRAVACLKKKVRIDGIKWTLQTSEHDGGPEYISALGWVGRPPACYRGARTDGKIAASAAKPWLCGAPGDEPKAGPFRTMKAAVRSLYRDCLSNIS